MAKEKEYLTASDFIRDYDSTHPGESGMDVKRAGAAIGVKFCLNLVYAVRKSDKTNRMKRTTKKLSAEFAKLASETMYGQRKSKFSTPSMSTSIVHQWAQPKSLSRKNLTAGHEPNQRQVQTMGLLAGIVSEVGLSHVRSMLQVIEGL